MRKTDREPLFIDLDRGELRVCLHPDGSVSWSPLGDFWTPARVAAALTPAIISAEDRLKRLNLLQQRLKEIA